MRVRYRHKTDKKANMLWEIDEWIWDLRHFFFFSCVRDVCLSHWEITIVMDNVHWTLPSYKINLLAYITTYGHNQTISWLMSQYTNLMEPSCRLSVFDHHYIKTNLQLWRSLVCNAINKIHCREDVLLRWDDHMQANICPNTPHDTHPKIILAESTLLGGFVLKMNIFWSDP